MTKKKNRVYPEEQLREEGEEDEEENQELTSSSGDEEFEEGGDEEEERTQGEERPSQAGYVYSEGMNHLYDHYKMTHRDEFLGEKMGSYNVEHVCIPIQLSDRFPSKRILSSKMGKKPLSSIDVYLIGIQSWVNNSEGMVGITFEEHEGERVEKQDKTDKSDKSDKGPIENKYVFCYSDTIKKFPQVFLPGSQQHDIYKCIYRGKDGEPMAKTILNGIEFNPQELEKGGASQDDEKILPVRLIPGTKKPMCLLGYICHQLNKRDLNRKTGEYCFHSFKGKRVKSIKVNDKDYKKLVNTGQVMLRKTFLPIKDIDYWNVTSHSLQTDGSRSSYSVSFSLDIYYLVSKSSQ